MKIWISILLLAGMVPMNAMAESLCYKGGNFFWTQKKLSCDAMADYGKFQAYFGSNLETQTDSDFYCRLVASGNDKRDVDCIMNRSRADLVDYVSKDAQLSRNEALMNVLKTQPLSPSELRAQKQTASEFSAADWKAEAEAMEDSAAGR